MHEYAMRNRPPNQLFYGDNLTVLRREIPDASVDLVYLDPPLNSNANYNILFKSPAGTSADAQIEAFEDSWHWNDSAEDAFDCVARSGNIKAFDLLKWCWTLFADAGPRCMQRSVLGDNGPASTLPIWPSA